MEEALLLFGAGLLCLVQTTPGIQLLRSNISNRGIPQNGRGMGLSSKTSGETNHATSPPSILGPQQVGSCQCLSANFASKALQFLDFDPDCRSVFSIQSREKSCDLKFQNPLKLQKYAKIIELAGKGLAIFILSRSGRLGGTFKGLLQSVFVWFSTT